jgi:hypothetical protein
MKEDIPGKEARMKTSTRLMTFACAALVGGLAVTACGQADDMDTVEMEGHDMGAMQGDDMGGMTMDPALMTRHAAEMDSVVQDVRQHVEEMRDLPPAEWHDRMDEHAPMVAHMVGVVERQTLEMDRGLNLGDEEMGAMMGMSGEEHRSMMDDVRVLRNEIGEMQTAPEAEVAERMPAHLDRIERMLMMMDRSATHMSTP